MVRECRSGYGSDKDLYILVILVQFYKTPAKIPDRFCVSGTLVYISSTPNHYYITIFAFPEHPNAWFQYTQPQFQNARQRFCVSSTVSYNSRTPITIYISRTLIYSCPVHPATIPECPSTFRVSSTPMQSPFQNVHHRFCISGTLAYISSTPKNHYRISITIFFQNTHIHVTITQSHNFRMPINVSRFQYTQPSYCRMPITILHFQYTQSHFQIAHQRICVSKFCISAL